MERFQPLPGPSYAGGLMPVLKPTEYAARIVWLGLVRDREAALAAVWMHGKAADEMVDAGRGPRGLMASELLPGIRSLLNQLDRG